MSSAPSISHRRFWSWWDRQPVYGGPIPDGVRNERLMRIAVAVRARGATLEDVLSYLLRVNALRCVPALPEWEVQAIARSICRYRSESGPRSPGMEPRRRYREIFPDPELVPDRVRLILIRRLAEFYVTHGHASPITSSPEGD